MPCRFVGFKVRYEMLLQVPALSCVYICLET